jgi:uncharacterized RDD family membrane protein YckC
LAQCTPDAGDGTAPAPPPRSEDFVVVSEMSPMTGTANAAGSATTSASPDEAASEADVSTWRDELSARLNRYRARRKVRPPRYPSLSLQFEAPESPRNSHAVPTPSDSPEFEPVSDHALALDGMMRGPSAADETGLQDARSESAVHGASGLTNGATVAKTAKIIEFPRFAWGPPPPPPDQLAEPVSSDRPRILEAPEIVPAAPALGGITIEAVEPKEDEKRPGIDVPLQSASLPRRALASAIDALIVTVASALFGFIFWKVAAVRPPLIQVLGLATGIPWLLWMVYQYLLIVYAAGTPGLRAAGLELARFDGTSTNRRLRRWRVLAACLSGVSLGMGYAWVFLDEDALCWHDRITHTYLAPRKAQANPGFPKA